MKPTTVYKRELAEPSQFSLRSKDEERLPAARLETRPSSPRLLRTASARITRRRDVTARRAEEVRPQKSGLPVSAIRLRGLRRTEAI